MEKTSSIRENEFWLKWIFNYSMNELLIIGVTTTVGRLVLVELSDIIAQAPGFVTPLFLALIGMAEGWTIGYLQWRSLKKIIANIESRRWILATIITTVAGWLIIIPPTIFSIAFFADFGLLHRYYSILYALAAGAGFGGIVGVVQSLILRRYFRHSVVWLLSNTFGWMLSFLTIYFSISLIGAAHSFGYNLAVITFACIFSGGIQGLITGSSLHFLMSVRKEYKSVR